MSLNKIFLIEENKISPFFYKESGEFLDSDLLGLRLRIINGQKRIISTVAIG